MGVHSRVKSLSGDTVSIGQEKALLPANLTSSPVFPIGNESLSLEGLLALMDNSTTWLKLRSNILRHNVHPGIQWVSHLPSRCRFFSTGRAGKRSSFARACLSDIMYEDIPLMYIGGLWDTTVLCVRSGSHPREK
jgi:hypothetical protein